MRTLPFPFREFAGQRRAQKRHALFDIVGLQRLYIINYAKSGRLKEICVSLQRSKSLYDMVKTKKIIVNNTEISVL